MVVHVGARSPGHISRVGGGWQPAELGASLLGYWDAERADLVTQAAGAVSSWKDAVAGYDAVQATAGSKPTYSATSFNGRPGITFDGTDDELTATAVPFPTADAAVELWALVDQTTLAADASDRVIFSYSGASSTTGRSIRRAQVAAANRLRAASGDGATSTTLAETTVDFSGRHIVRGRFGAGGRTAEIDGVSSTTDARTDSASASLTRIGALSNSGASLFFMGVASALLVTSALSAAQATQLRAYLKVRGNTP